MPIITLITDWKSADYYIGAIKGKILSQSADINIVDINHQIESYNVAMAAFVLKYSYSHFPKGSVHIISVDSEVSARKPVVALQYDGHFFISTDNGIFSLLMEEELGNIVEIPNQDNGGIFPELNIFANTALHIALNQEIKTLGKSKNKVFRLLKLQATIEQSVIIGHIIYVDSYGNAITNVEKSTFEKIRSGRDFKIYVQSKSNLISEINTSYNQSSEGELLAIFNSIDYLEIAIRKGNVCQLLNLDRKLSSIRIVFENKRKAEAGHLF